MSIESSQIQRILVISLSNIGDVVLTFPVIDILRRDFPKAEISVVVGPKGEPLLKGNPHFKEVYVYNKKQSIPTTLRWVWELRQQRFDLVVDLRNSFTPFVIGPRYKTSPFMTRVPGQHMRLQHLNRLKSVYHFSQEAKERFVLHISEENRRWCKKVFESHQRTHSRTVVIAPGAADQNKRWTSEGFAEVADAMIDQLSATTIFVGDKNDQVVVGDVLSQMHHQDHVVNLTGEISLIQLAALLEQASLAVVNDSAPMHLASYLNVPVVALFGPTDERKYGPWSQRAGMLARRENCQLCQKVEGASKHTCMGAISSEDVLNLVFSINTTKPKPI
ncbi:MAG: glycosyltransferase family 9 protein [Candidatus Omnitrophica bacterium]|nr:glycosyltransferase family 9 protein [Candidatus Omnitrophota bacterium]